MIKPSFDDSYSAVASPCVASLQRELMTQLAEGRNRLQLGDQGGADALLTSVLDQQPGHYEARLLRGDARYSLGRFADAQRDYAAVVQGAADIFEDACETLDKQAPPRLQVTDTALAQAHAGLAHVLSRSIAPGSLAQAQTHLRAAQSARGELPQGLWERLAEARVAFEGGDVDDAQQTVGVLLEQHRNNPRVWLSFAEMCDARGQFTEAAQAAERACAVAVDDTAALMSQTLEALRHDGDAAQAVLGDCLVQLQARTGQPRFALVLAKLQACELTEPQKAALLKAAARLSPSSPTGEGETEQHKQWLVAHYEPRRHIPAEKLSLRTADPAALAACAISALRVRGPDWQQRFDASFELLEQRYGPLAFWTCITKAEQAVDTPMRVAQLLQAAAAINPDDRMTQMLILRVQSRLGTVDPELLERLQASRPSEAMGTRIFVLELKAETAKHEGDYANAIEALDTLCAIRPEARYYALRASLKLALSYAPDEVQQDCALGLSYDGLHYLALYTRAQQDLISRNFSSSAKTLQLCRTKYPEQPDPLYVLGEVASSQGMSGQAIEQYKAYLKGSFPIGRHYENEARLALAQAQLNTRDYAGALDSLVQIDQNQHALHSQAKALRTLVIKRQSLQERGIYWWASLPDIETLIDQKQYDKALATLHHHGAQNSRNVYSLALRARVHLEMGNFAQAEADAQMAQDIAFYDCLNEPLSAHILREAQSKNGSLMRMLTDSLTSITDYFQSWP